jgi:hypothetical protein
MRIATDLTAPLSISANDRSATCSFSAGIVQGLRFEGEVVYENHHIERALQHHFDRNNAHD